MTFRGSGGGNVDAMSDGADKAMSDGADEVEFAFFTACEFHCLHPFSPSDNSLCKAYLRDHSLPAWLCRFHKDRQGYHEDVSGILLLSQARRPRSPCQ